MNGNEGQWMTMNDNERSWMTMNDNELQRTIVNDRRKFRSQTSDDMDTWKSRGGKRKSQKKEDAGARKGRKVAIHCVFPMFCGSGSLKRRDRKAHVRPSRSAVNEPGRSKMKHTVGLVTNLLSSPPHCKGLRRSQVSGIHFSKHHKSANIFDLLSRTVPLMPRYKHTHIYIYIYTDTVFWPWHKNDLYCTL